MVGAVPSSYYSNAVKRPVLNIQEEDRFYLDLDFLTDFDGQEPEWGPVGKFTYKRTYARPLSEDNSGTEEFWQTLARITNGIYTVQKWHCRHHNLPWSDAKAQRSAQTMFRLMWDFKFLPGGRGLWMMGTDYVEKHGSAALNNCSFVSTNEIDINFAEPFCFLMDYSMLGVGVGSDCRGAGKVTIVQPTQGDDVHVVPDTREGWVELLFRYLEAYIGNGTIPKEVDYSKVRPYGALIRGFGGTASGPDPLIRLISEVQRILEPLTDKLITSEAIVDLCDLIGVCVVAGNVRRTAIIMFGEHDDEAFLNLKNPKFSSAAMKTHRWACVTGDTLVDTVEGLRPISDLVGREDVVVRLDGQQHKALGVKLTGRKPTFTVSTVGGPVVRATANHQFMTKRGWVRLDALKSDDRLIVGAHCDVAVDKASVDYGRGYMLGCLIGDGTFTTTTSTRTPIARVMAYAGDAGHRSVVGFVESVFDFDTRSDFDGFSGPHGKDGSAYYFLSAKAFTDYAASFGVTRGSKTITPAIEQAGSVDFQAGVMSGLFDSDGWVIGDRRTLAIEQADLDIIQRMQRILLRLGIQSRITKGKSPESRVIAGAARQCKQMWRLVLCGYDNAARFVDTCGIHHDVKLATWNNIDPPPTTKGRHTFAIESIVETGQAEDVYDICVPGPRAFLANGLYVHNSNNSVFAKVGMDYTQTAAISAKAGEPGYMWLDIARKFGRTGEPCDDKRVLGFNPCQPAWAPVLTPDGIRTIGDIDAGSIVWSGKQWTKVLKKWSTGIKPVIAYKTRAGAFYGTENHRIVQDGEKIEVKDAEAIDIAPVNPEFITDVGSISARDVVDGLVIGDGLVHRASNDLVLLIVGQDDQDYFSGEIAGLMVKHRPGVHDGYWTVDTTIEAPELPKTYDREIPDRFYRGDVSTKRGFLRGLYSANGSVVASRVTLKASSFRVIEQAQQMLSSLGIRSYYTVNKSHDVEFENGTYTCRESYDLNTSDRSRFRELIGFLHEDKCRRLDVICDKPVSKYAGKCPKTTYDIVEREALGEQEVFDITVEAAEHTYWTGGLLVSNCAEISLESYELCVGGKTKLQTKEGVFPIDEIVGKKVDVWNGDSWSTVEPRITGQGRDLYRVTLSDGSHLDCTSNHGWHVKPSGKRVFRRVEAQDLKIGDRVVEFDISAPISGRHEPNAFEWGLFTGDGYIEKQADYPMVAICGDKAALKDLDVGGVWWKPQIREGYSDPYNRLCLRGLLTMEDATHINAKGLGLPQSVFNMDRESALQFVAGWIEADGTVAGKGTSAEGYRVYGAEPKMRDLQVLLRRIGVNHSTIRLFGEEGDVTNFGKRNYDLWYCQIPSYESAEIPTRLKTIENIGSRYAMNNAHPDGASIDRARKQKIVSVEKLSGRHTTYCFDEPENHMAVFGNVLTYQCNLAELFPSRHSSYEEFERTIKYAYLYAKTVSLIPTHNPRTNSVMLRNRRIGLSQSGIVQSFKRHGRRKHFTWCDQGYGYVRKLDRLYSEWLCVRKSIKTTTVKPAGTTSLLPGVTPGIHFEHAEYYFRTVRVASYNPLVEEYRKAGYRVEQDVYDQSKRTSVVYFPIKAQLFDRSKSDVSIWEQMENAAQMQKNWSDNSVSVTVTFKPEEADDIQRCLELYEGRLKTVSFLPLMDHGYAQAPYITITKAEYEEAVSALSEASFNGIGHSEEDTPRYCDSDSCVVVPLQVTKEGTLP